MRPRKGSRVRHAEMAAWTGRILRLYEEWDAEARCWEPVAHVAWDRGDDNIWPLRDLVPVRRGEREEE